MTTAVITDGTSVLNAVWFNPYIRIREGEELLLSGKLERFRGKLQMKSPDVDRGNDGLVTGRVVPIHSSAAGFSPWNLRKAIHNALLRARPIHEVLPEDLLDRYDLVDRDASRRRERTHLRRRHRRDPLPGHESRGRRGPAEVGVR